MQGDQMKKYIFPVILSLTIGISLSYLMIKSYDNASAVTVSAGAEKVYFIQRGVYSNKQNMINSMNDFENYVYSVEDNQYHAYIGITKSKNNATKIKQTYEQDNLATYTIEKNINNKEFSTILTQYDDVLSKTDDVNTIKVIENQVISKYKETIEK